MNCARHNAESLIPGRSHRLAAWFSWYSNRLLKRHFASFRITQAGYMPSPSALNGPAVIYLNHASWWDPIVCLNLAQAFFSSHQSFAPIDAEALEKYKFFSKLGFFPVARGDARSAAQFLRTSRAILRSHNSLLWITPHGRFVDVRERPVKLMSGISHLVRLPGVTFLPLAIEYSFWQEKKPEVLVAFGPPLRLHAPPSEALPMLETALELTQDKLASAVQGRRPAEFQSLWRSKTGASPVYDAWRELVARIRGRQFTPQHCPE